MRLIRSIALVILSGGCSMAFATHARAANVDGANDPETGTVTARAEVGPLYSFTPSGGGGGVPRCVWDALRRGDVIGIGNTGAALTPQEAAEPATRDQNGRLEQLYSVVCTGADTTLRYVPIGVDVDDLLAGIVDQVQGRLQLPVPSINPTPEANGIVNLGLWLAVEPQTLDAITAQAGPSVWITVTPTLTATTFDLGNGDSITCDTTGVPIETVHPDLDVIEQSPTCGYTYLRSSPDDTPYQLSITTTWTLPYTSSEGAGEIPPLERTITIDYDVDEIQTIGVRG